MSASSGYPEGDSLLGDQSPCGVHVQGVSGCPGAGPPVPDAHCIGAGDPRAGI